MSEQTYARPMQEYYIRKEGDEDSRGPFTLDQLTSLVEAGQVDRQTFYYDSLAEKWVEVQSNAELVATLFPLKKKLSMRSKDTVPTINVKPAEDEKPITVEEMLAAAQGNTEETRDKRDISGLQARAAHWGLRLLSFMLVISAAGMLVHNMDHLMEGSLPAILGTPQVVFGLVDLGLALLLFLELTSLYTLVRLRAAVGFGFFAFYFWVSRELAPLAAVTASSIALFSLTLVANLPAVILLGILGLAGTGFFAYTLLQ